MSATDISAALENGDGEAPAPAAPPPPLPPFAAVPPVAPPTIDSSELPTPPQPPRDPETVPEKTVDVQSVVALDPAVAAFCVPISQADPSGPDLDFDGDGDYLNFLASAEGMLPTSFFSVEDGKPFDRTTVDLPGQIAGIDALLRRSRDLRLRF